MEFACSECGHRQEEQAACDSCGEHESVFDLRKAEIRAYFRGIDQRIQDRAERRFRAIGVAVGMVTVIGLMCIPLYREIRSEAFALPMLADQIILMALVGMVVIKLLESRFGPPLRFPYVKPIWVEMQEEQEANSSR